MGSWMSLVWTTRSRSYALRAPGPKLGTLV